MLRIILGVALFCFLLERLIAHFIATLLCYWWHRWRHEYTACIALGEFFHHTNVRTPRWVGYKERS